jgi:hypothetical protein
MWGDVSSVLLWPPPNLWRRALERKDEYVAAVRDKLTSACTGHAICRKFSVERTGRSYVCRYIDAVKLLEASSGWIVGSLLPLILHIKYCSWSLSQKYNGIHVTWTIKEQQTKRIYRTPKSRTCSLQPKCLSRYVQNTGHNMTNNVGQIFKIRV